MLPEILKRFCVICGEKGYSSGEVVVVNSRGEGFCSEHEPEVSGLKKAGPTTNLTEVARRGSPDTATPMFPTHHSMTKYDE